MTNEEKLIRTRNLVRHILKMLGSEIDVKSRNNHKFFFDLMGRCAEVGVVEEDRGLFRMTDKEKETGHREGARHRGRHFA